ncbi:hypothetical protein VNO80_05055 [Phaseolus coccineus]|uniref:Uncharacterized protein n=1 Tax=Phaseolus coccineus TaxID=3886 RepID=A0AAN9NUU1_PHACN
MQFCGTRKVDTAVAVDRKVGLHPTVVKEQSCELTLKNLNPPRRKEKKVDWESGVKVCASSYAIWKCHFTPSLIDILSLLQIQNLITDSPYYKTSLALC